MRDRVLIISGLALFLGMFTYPVWHGIANGASTQDQLLDLPGNQKTCVAPQEFMRTSHMQLLIAWRDDSVRQGHRTYAAYDGASYRIGLTNTCLDECHGGKKEFCDRCHGYVGLPTPHCWDCHQDVPARAGAMASSTVPVRLP